MRTIQKVHCRFADVVNDLKTQGVILEPVVLELVVPDRQRQKLL
ncbi:hypothetical protein Tco_0640833, partial [Tanacetum coccineum]